MADKAITGTTIEILPPKWSSPEAKELYEMYERMLAAAYQLPPHLVGASDAIIAEFYSRMQVATASIAKQARDIHNTHAMPQILMKGSE